MGLVARNVKPLTAQSVAIQAKLAAFAKMGGKSCQHTICACAIKSRLSSSLGQTG
jgi:hypothetical protein